MVGGFMTTALILSGCGESADDSVPVAGAAELATVPDDVTTNVLTPEEEAEGWRLLFDGTDLSQWRGYRMDTVPPDWGVTDGAIHFQSEHGGEGYGDLQTRQEFGDFELVLEWKISECGNSGILYRVSEDAEQEFMTGPEYQLIDADSECYPDLGPDRTSGANYGLDAPAVDATKPAGEWNSTRIVLDGAHVEHWLNGEKVVEYELWTDEWKEKVAQTKFAEWPGYGMNKRGHIVLQDHGAEVWFRNIKIRELD